MFWREDVQKKKLDEYPAHEINGIKYKRGRVKPFGASIVGYDVIDFSVFSKNAKSCELLLYTLGEKEPFAVLPFPEGYRICNVFSMMVFGLNFEEPEYGYRFDGEYAPGKGHRFKREAVLLDPYAKLVGGR